MPSLACATMWTPTWRIRGRTAASPVRVCRPEFGSVDRRPQAAVGLPVDTHRTSAGVHPQSVVVPGRPSTTGSVRSPRGRRSAERAGWSAAARSCSRSPTSTPTPTTGVRESSSSTEPSPTKRPAPGFSVLVCVVDNSSSCLRSAGCRRRKGHLLGPSRSQRWSVSGFCWWLRRTPPEDTRLLGRFCSSINP